MKNCHVNIFFRGPKVHLIRNIKYILIYEKQVSSIIEAYSDTVC